MTKFGCSVHEATANSRSERLTGSPVSIRLAYLHLCSFAILLVLGTILALAGRVGFAGRLRHLHAAIMTYLCLIPGVPVALTGLLLPRLVGIEHCQGTKFARAGLIAYVGSAIVIIISALGGGIDSGISYFGAYSRHGHSASLGMAFGVLLVGFACAFEGLYAINAARSFLSNRARSRVVPALASLFCLVGGVHLLLLPLQCVTISMMVVERLGGYAFFDPSRGGDAILLRQMSWFYLHPVILISALPAFGLIAYVIEQVSTRPGPAQSISVHSGVAVSILGLLTGGVHLIQMGLSPLFAAMSSALNLLLMVPMSLLVADCLSRLDCKNGDRTSIWLALSALLVLSLGLLAGVAPTLLGLNSSLHGTDFALGHVHLVASATCILSVIAGLNFIWGGLSKNKWRTAFLVGVSICLVSALLVTFGLHLIEGIGESRGQHLVGCASRHRSALFQSGSVISSVGLLTLSVVFINAIIRGRKVHR
jgi:cytochrome c oxidase subunit 1